MSTTTYNPSGTAEQQVPQQSPAQVATQIVIALGPWYEDASGENLAPLLRVLREALGDLLPQAAVAYPASDPQANSWEYEGVHLQPYLPTVRLQPLAVQNAATYLSLYEVMRTRGAACGVLLGSEAHTLAPAAIRAMVTTVLDGRADLAVACYQVGANEGLLNASILHPLSRAVFGIKASFPLAPDLALSSRMAERMATDAQRRTATAQPEAVIWPVAEAALASYTVAEINVGVRELPHPAGNDLPAILNTVAASLFSDIEAKASFWQRTRPPVSMAVIPAVPIQRAVADPVPRDELLELIEDFRIAYGNLHEIWSLVLPPQTLLGLKRLSRGDADSFSLPDALWVRIIYDYVLAHRLRTINRGHLMGSLTPLYLAWVASHILAGQPDALESLSKAFEADKPYLVSRWRWPDRFNP